MRNGESLKWFKAGKVNKIVTLKSNNQPITTKQMKAYKQKRLHIQGMIKSLHNTPCDARALVKALEDITGVKKNCDDKPVVPVTTKH